jgi:hypothetical protein
VPLFYDNLRQVRSRLGKVCPWMDQYDVLTKAHFGTSAPKGDAASAASSTLADWPFPPLFLRQHCVAAAP